MSANRIVICFGMGAAVSALVGCAGAELSSKVRHLEKTVEGLQRDLAVARTRLDDMANQVALLTVRGLQRRADTGPKEPQPTGGGSSIASTVPATGRPMAGVGDEDKIRALSVEKVRRRARVSLGPEPGERPMKAEPSSDGREEASARDESDGVRDHPQSASALKQKGREFTPPDRRSAPGAVVARDRGSEGTVARLYAAARKTFEAKKYLDAISAFTDIAVRHSESPLAENATFWIGAAYFERGEYALALREFERVVSEFAKGRKGADAIYRAGLCHLKLNSVRDARARFLAVVNRFPSSDAAQSARKALAELGKE